MAFEKQAYQTQIIKKVGLNYWLYLPPDYESRDKWPLVMFLHGRGERSDDLDLVKLHGLPKNIVEGQHFPFVIVAPQCPITSYWSEQTEALNALIDHIIASYLIDINRVYLTGLSMGGTGTWFLAGRFPEKFAAIAPICGSGLKWLA